MTVKPYAAEGSKREQVELMFDRISPKYDLLNRLCSLGTDQGWRRKVIRGVGKEPVDRLLDVATGTVTAWTRPAGIEGLDLASLPSLFDFPLDMARVPAEVNRLSNQVLVTSYETEWGRVAR